MKELNLNINIQEFAFDELNADDRQLVEEAIKATENSYAPYSKFNVGAAIRLENGMIIHGANQENAAYPVSLCAERAAIFAAQSNYPEQPIVALAIAAKNVNGPMAKPVSPCGSCRQVILEIEERYQKPMRILLYGKDKTYAIDTVKDLLPLCFVESDMR